MVQYYNFGMDDIVLATEYIHKFFGFDEIVTPKVFANRLPIAYMSSYNFYQVKGDFNSILISPKDNVYNFNFLIGVYNYLLRTYNEQPIFFIKTPTNHLKKQFKFSSISYISIDGDFYLPNDKREAVHGEVETSFKYTKATQLVINYYLECGSRIASTREIADRLGISASAVSRSQVFLNNIGALTRMGSGIIKYKLESKDILLKKTEPYWINPYNERFNVLLSKKEFDKNKHLMYQSGDTAFSSFTNLTEPYFYSEYAISKEIYKDVFMELKNKKAYLSAYNDNDAMYSIEVFIYNPNIFGKDNIISKFDLYIMMMKRYKNNKDPRIDEALSSLRKELVR